jgi:hypothetical protein
MALLATKRYYFGVGGGSAEFIAALRAYPGIACECVMSFEDGRSNVRDILAVRWHTT